jgi:tRNA A-37 threonylcarbamoyl transferase component Bud32
VLTPESLSLELPVGYGWVAGERGLMAVWQEAAEALRGAGFGPDSDGELLRSEAVGRTPLGELRVGSAVFLVRRFSHGGLLRWLSGARFSDPRRPFEELLLSHGLGQRGVRTPRVVAARAVRAGAWWELAVVTERVEGGVDLGRWIAEVRQGTRSREGLGALAEAFGRLVRELHEVGFRHADLQPNNVLVEEMSALDQEPRLWILDLDRSVLCEAQEHSTRLANLGRLLRFVERRERERGDCLTARDRMRFLRGYESERSRRRELWHALAGGVRARARHGIGWKLERAFGGVDPRED